MDIKRLFLAIIVSFVFMIAWTMFFGQEKADTHQQNDALNVSEYIEDDLTQNNINNQAPQQNVASALDLVPGLSKKWKNEKKIFHKSALLSLELGNGGTSIQSASIIEKINENSTELRHKGGWYAECSNSNFITQESCESYGNSWVRKPYDRSRAVNVLNGECNPCLTIQNDVVAFTYDTTIVDGHKTVISAKDYDYGITKETIIYENSYVVDHFFTGLNGLPDKSYSLIWSGGVLPSEESVSKDLEFLSIFLEDGKSYKEEFLSGTESVGRTEQNIGWAGIRTKYFMKAISNTNHESLKCNKVMFTYHDDTNNGWTENFIYSDIEFQYDNINDNLAVESYIGPIDTQYLADEKTAHLEQLFGYGWVFIGYLGKGIMWLLMSLHQFIPNYGVVCILFAVIIRLFTGPLTKKSFIANQKMQALQPKIKKLQEKYKDDKQKLSQATMALYKDEGVNPLGGCLPILVQMPLLIALFQVFRKTIEFRGAEFLPFWITDLSQPDIIWAPSFLSNIPLLGYFFKDGLALLPILMGVVMFLNMKMTTATAEGPQKYTMYFMNGFFILLFNTFPSGLNLYYTIYNLLNFIQQRKLKQLQA